MVIAQALSQRTKHCCYAYGIRYHLTGDGDDRIRSSRSGYALNGNIARGANIGGGTASLDAETIEFANIDPATLSMEILLNLST